MPDTACRTGTGDLERGDRCLRWLPAPQVAISGAWPLGGRQTAWQTAWQAAAQTAWQTAADGQPWARGFRSR